MFDLVHEWHPTERVTAFFRASVVFPGRSQDIPLKLRGHLNALHHDLAVGLGNFNLPGV